MFIYIHIYLRILIGCALEPHDVLPTFIYIYLYLELIQSYRFTCLHIYIYE
jgi:hypothetical protein